jgi:formylglycine-generating enzyme required for sulfatase activity
LKSEEPDKAKKSAVDTMLGKEPGQARDDNGLKLKLVWCPPGKFTMGSPKSEADRNNDEDQVEVALTKGFWLGKFEATRSEWKQMMANEPWNDGQRIVVEGADDIPATNVRWEEGMEFCRKLTERERQAGRVPEGWEYTLPTEAQWERACRAQTETRFSFGDDESKLGEYAWFAGNATKSDEKTPHHVGQKKPNAWGLYDMHGNVWEFCRDWSGKLPGGSDPEVTQLGVTDHHRAIRGGSWGNTAWSCRSAERAGSIVGARNVYLGFRVARSSSGDK